MAIVRAGSAFAAVDNTGTPVASLGIPSVTATSGHYGILFVRWNGGSGHIALSSVADDSGVNTWTRVGTAARSAGNDDVECWHVIYGSSATINITATFAASVPFVSMSVADFTSDNPLTQLAAVTGTGSGTTVTSGAISTTHAESVIFGAAEVANLNTTWTPQSGYATVGPAEPGAAVLYVEYQVFASVQSSVTVSADNSDGSNTKCILAVSFECATGGNPWYYYSQQ